MAAFTLAGIDLGSTLGVTFLGVALSSMIYGITCLQTFIYYWSVRAKMDGIPLRSLVAIVFLCESFHQVVILHATYHYLILGFAQPLSLITTLVWSIPMETIMNSEVADSMFLRRIKIGGMLKRKAASLRTDYGSVRPPIRPIYCVRTNLEDSQPPCIPLCLRSLYLFYLIVHNEGADRLVGSSYHSERCGDGCLRNLRAEKALRKPHRLAQIGRPHHQADCADDHNGDAHDVMQVGGPDCGHSSALHTRRRFQYITAHDNLYVLFFNFMVGKLSANALLTSLNTRQYIQGQFVRGAIDNSSTAASTDGPPDASTFVESQPGFDTVIRITAEKVLALESDLAECERTGGPALRSDFKLMNLGSFVLHHAFKSKNLPGIGPCDLRGGGSWIGRPPRRLGFSSSRLRLGPRSRSPGKPGTWGVPFLLAPPLLYLFVIVPTAPSVNQQFEAEVRLL
ncbi:hypothetical protein V8D89_008469 [Ganoderma adspersum]